MPTSSSWTDEAAVYIAALVAVITFVYVILTHQLARSARRQLSSQMMPPLLIQVHQQPESAIEIRLANHGTVGAFDVQIIILGGINGSRFPVEKFIATQLKSNPKPESFSPDKEGWYWLRDKLNYGNVPPQAQVCAQLNFPPALVENGISVWLQYRTAIGEVFGQLFYFYPVQGRTRYAGETSAGVPLRQRRLFSVPYFTRFWLLNLPKSLRYKMLEKYSKTSLLPKRAPRYLGAFRRELRDSSVSVGFLEMDTRHEWDDRGEWSLLK